MAACLSPAVRILWPEARIVSAECIIGWAHDSWSDNPDGTEPVTLTQAIALLKDRGEVTFARCASCRGDGVIVRAVEGSVASYECETCHGDGVAREIA